MDLPDIQWVFRDNYSLQAKPHAILALRKKKDVLKGLLCEGDEFRFSRKHHENNLMHVILQDSYFPLFPRQGAQLHSKGSTRSYCFSTS